MLLLLFSQDTLQVKVSVVAVGVRVTDSRGRDVRGLKVENFSVFDDGVAQKIEFFSDEEQPITLGILLDKSDSMKYTAKIERAKEAALALVRSTTVGSEFFYIAFDQHVTPTEDLTTDRQRIESAIQQTKTGGGTSLYDAVLSGVALTSRAHLPRQAIVVISDGTDQNSRRRLADVMKVARQSKIQVYTIGYFSGPEEILFRKSGTRIELIDGAIVDNPRVVLGKLARESGAVSFFPRSDQELTKAVEEITKDLRTQYTVAFYPKSPDAENRYHQLRVTVRGGRYNVRARPGYGTPQ